MSRLALLCLTLLAAGGAAAYEEATHVVITKEAVKRSVLQSSPAALLDVGIDKGIADVTQRFPNSRRDDRTILELLQDGAEIEDSVSLLPFVVRPMRHFFDPTTGLGMPAGVFGDMQASPNWMLLGVGTDSLQEHSYWNAREYYYQALTAASEADRRRGFGLAFQTLGHVAHHLQDMAQPQHVRSDVHCHTWIVCAPVGIQYAPSLYEKWTDLPVVRAALATRIDTSIYDITGAEYTSTFNTPRRFWHTEDPGPMSPLLGKGIAEFTNRNFVSAGTNFDQSPARYAFPVVDPALEHDVTIAELCKTAMVACSTSLAATIGVMKFHGTSGVDAFLAREVHNPRASTESLFDAPLRTIAMHSPVYTLNRFNFEAGYPHLLGRAGAHTAGLINYFFRARIDAAPDPDPARPDTLLVRNLANEAMEGAFGLYYDDAQKVRRAVQIRECRIGGAAVVVLGGKCRGARLPAANVDAGARLSITYEVPASPAPGVKDEYMVVFDGQLGEEAAPGPIRSAVAGKLLANPYHGALYILGENSLGQRSVFRVDRAGVSPLAPGEANPLAAIQFEPGARERAYLFKQVQFTPGPRGPVHRTVGLAFNTRFGDSSLFPPSPSVTGLQPQFGLSWRAYSPDPAIGWFDFRLNVLDPFIGRRAELVYTRRFVNAEGQLVVQAPALLRLPDIPSNALLFYTDFSRGGMIVNADGTEFRPRGHQPSRRFGVRITLAPVPTAAFFDLPQGTQTGFSRNNQPAVGTTAGECVLAYETGTPPVAASRSAPRSTFEQVLVDNESFSSAMMVEDYMEGELLAWEDQRHFRGYKKVRMTTCEIAVEDTSAGVVRAKYHLERQQQTELIQRTEDRNILRDGSIDRIIDPIARVPRAAGYGCGVAGNQVPIATWIFGTDFADMRYDYEGFSPCPVQTADALEAVSNPNNIDRRIYRALTHRPLDAAYTEPTVVGSILFSAIKFRGQMLLPGPGFVADASPVGEVFIAARDLSYIVHEPKPGNMQVLTRDRIPAGIVRLVAALWL